MKKFILLFLLLSPAQAEILDIVTYFDYSTKTYQIVWNLVTEANSYDLRAVHRETNTIVFTANTTETNFEFIMPKSGHYIIEIRSKNISGVSEWVSSINPQFATVNSEPKGWWIYGYIKPPGGIIID